MAIGFGTVHVVQALRAIAGIGARHAAAAVIDPSGVIATHGELEHTFALASLTKLLSAYAVLIASEERLVALDDPAGPPGSSIADLLSHASGLHPTDAGRILVPPGRRRIYSSAAYEVLGELVGERAVMTFAEYVHDGVLEPLGMKESDPQGSPAHGAHASTADLCRFASELLEPTLIDPSTLERAVQTNFPGLAGVLPGFGRFDPCDWGLGFELRGHKSPHWTGENNSPATFGHFGQAGSCIWLDPARQVVLIVCADRPFGPWATLVWPELSDAVLAELDVRE